MEQEPSMPVLQSESLWNSLSLPQGEFDERLGSDGMIRPHWNLLSQQLDTLGPKALQERSAAIDQFIREDGVTVNSGATDGQSERPWSLSPVPFLIGSQEWNVLAAGLASRSLLLETVLNDLLGPQRLIQEGIVPGELLWANPSFFRAYHALAGSRQKLHITATDIARDADGVWRVTGDRTRAPSGLGYLLENRIATSRVMPTLIRRSNTLRLASFFESVKEHLYSLATTQRDDPRVVLLTPPSGSYREFEDNYLARYLGLTLIQGRDLAVRGDRLHLKTLGGLQPIQVLWRHISDRRCDPLELDPSSTDGVTGLLRCVRRQSVAVVNAIGSVLVQTPALLPYLDAAHNLFFGGPLKLNSATTYWCGDQRHRQYVLANVDHLLFRDAFAVSGGSAIAVRQLPDTEREEFLGQLHAHGENFIAQEPIRYSQTPVWTGNAIEPKKVSLRSFQLLSEGSVNVLPGGLARVGQDQLELSRSPVCGQMTLDCWITHTEPLGEQKTLLKDSQSVPVIRRGGDELPSRVAEHLYWLGRYAERAEGIARVLRATLSRIAGEENWEELPEVRRLIRTLASMGQIEASFAVDSFAANLPHLEQTLPASILDREQPHGLARTMESVMHNTIAVRDRLSSEAFRIAKRAARDLLAQTDRTGKSDAPFSISEAIERIDRLVVDLLALAGLTCESVVRSHAWQFLELGRRIERAEQICELLIETVCPPIRNGKPVCETVLKITDSLMTYRSRYMNRTQLPPVIDMVITDETNPRSLRFQLDRIASLIDKLPTVEGPIGLDSIRRIVTDLDYRVKTADPIQLCELDSEGTLSNLKNLLTDISEDLPNLSSGIIARYLIHTESRQFLTGTGR